MFSPCEMCKIHLGKEYSSDCDLNCDYAQHVLLEKEFKAAVDPFIHKMQNQNEKVKLIDLVDTYFDGNGD